MNTLITGAGSLGSELVKKMLDMDGIGIIRIMDNNEYSLSKIKQIYCRNLDEYKKIRLLLGDICDSERVELAMNDIDVVVHTAARKNIDITEYNVEETIKTNVNGTNILCKHAVKARVSKFIYISTDKAVNPLQVYGVTKLLGEKVTLWYGKIQKTTRFSVIRPGNFYPSSGCVFEVWEEQLKQKKPITLTSTEMYRYFIDISDIADFVVKVMNIMSDDNYSPSIFIPKMKEYSIHKLAKEYSDNYIITGKRYGEKLREELFTEHEKKYHLKEMDGYYMISDIESDLDK